MPILYSNFLFLTFCGIWRPRNWTAAWKIHLYAVYTIFTLFLIFTFMLSGLIHFLITFGNLQEAANNSLLLLTNIGICYKAVNFIRKRRDIVKLVQILENDICQPRGDEEIAIQLKFDKRGKYNTVLLTGMASAAVISITIGAFLGNVPQRTLPFKAWLPFDHKTEVGFWIAFIHQTISHALAAAIGSYHDTFFHGIMNQTCAQLNILNSRLRRMPQTIKNNKWQISKEILERKELENCVRHHQEIFKFFELSNEIFNLFICIQYSVSAFVICVSTYTLSKTSFRSARFTFIIVYLACMILQIFLLCWFGNEVIIDSTDIGNAVYEMDWDLLSTSTKKDLRLIMVRTREPIIYTSGQLIALSLSSYNSLMKFSYSIYNLLQQTSE